MTLPDALPGTANTVQSAVSFAHDAQTQTAPIPEPGSTLLFGVGCLVAGIASRARRP
jgi:hypothetical protein